MKVVKMKLLKFRVTNFRSVEDSGWIETDEVTALVGTNESGKTNILLPLWKLKPARDGEINPLADFPRKHYGDIRAMKRKPIFIEAHFRLSDELASQIAGIAGVAADKVRVVSVSRNLGGEYMVAFPEALEPTSVERQYVADLIADTKSELGDLTALRTEEMLKDSMLQTLEQEQKAIQLPGDALNASELQEIIVRLSALNTASVPKTSIISPRYARLSETLQALANQLTAPRPHQNTDVRQLVLDNLPSFVYYSTYGNLDSEIYLPHVIQNMQRTDLGGREEAKARTLRVLFDFVGLSPQEILELGREAAPENQAPTEEQIKLTAAKKTEREILLQSASAKLTAQFREWWKQGDYRFRLQADGNHFRIWVSDDKRAEEIELEGRSSGLQWFLSFYLVFLVESNDAHKGAILLLDEPGPSLHPIAQRDLSVFFENLARTNQLLYSTHSPFLVDPNHLDRVRVVYVDDQGATVVSANLRASESRPAESRSIYPVHAALGLTVSEILLQGCQPVIVEGPSDQIYLSAIKIYLVRHGRISPSRELLFMPGGSRKGIGSLVAIVTGKEEERPIVILDSDDPGLRLARELKSQTYQGSEDRILLLGDICGLEGAEAEDLFPTNFLAGIVTKFLRIPEQEEDFDEIVGPTMPIVPQIEAYATRCGIRLEPGWKVEIAKRAKDRLLRMSKAIDGEDACVDRWTKLFRQLDVQALDAAKL